MTGLDRGFILTPRLGAVYELLGSGETVADIGTDHAYLPARLVLDGKYRRAVASDVVPGPLENARRTIDALGLADRIELRLAAGLTGLRTGESDAAAIAGMGGELIAAILKEGPVPPLLVLQPMTRQEKLRRFLAESGFRIEEERLAREGTRIYTVIKARPGGTRREVSEAEAVVGRTLEDNGKELAKEYLARKKAALIRAEKGNAAAGDRENAAFYRTVREEIEEYEKGF